MNEKEMRELDCWIAENVMGVAPVCHCGDLMSAHGMGSGHNPVQMTDWEFSPTTDPAAALSVLAKCAMRGKVSEHNILIFQPSDGPHAWAVGAEFVYEKDEIEPEYADTLPLAICAFARKLFSKE